jgi:chromatin remodeling complex protein RSC6
MCIMPKKSSTVKVSEPEPVVAPPVVEKKTEKVEKAEKVVESDDSALASYVSVTTKLSGFRQQLSGLITEVRSLQKQAERDLKAVQKAGNKRKQRNATRAPSGFVKPTLISDQLADFLSKPKGSLVARTEVTREINAYIRANNLQDQANRRKIKADAKLTKLLALTPTDELTYFNLQRYMSRHFQKQTPVTPA